MTNINNPNLENKKFENTKKEPKNIDFIKEQQINNIIEEKLKNLKLNPKNIIANEDNSEALKKLIENMGFDNHMPPKPPDGGFPPPPPPSAGAVVSPKEPEPKKIPRIMLVQQTDNSSIEKDTFDHLKSDFKKDNPLKLNKPTSIKPKETPGY